jgi:thiol-disulfide isomerase/thioredoxin
MKQLLIVMAGMWAFSLVWPDALSAQSVTVLNEQGLDSLVSSRWGRPLVLNLWATWCIPCREEFPDFLRASKEFPNVDAAVLSVDYPDEISSKIRPFIKRLNISLPVFVSSVKKQEVMINRLDERWNGALPATFIFTNDGVRDTCLVGKQNLKQFRAAFKRAASLK